MSIAIKHTTYLFTFFFAISFSLLAQAEPQTTYQGMINGGDHLAFSIDTKNKTIETKEITSNAIHTSCDTLLTRTPAWILPALREALRNMSQSEQEKWCVALKDVDDQIIDEVSFTLAHISSYDRQYFTPTLLIKNATLIYDIAPHLKYVELVEKTGDDGAYTTTKYKRLKDGTEESFEAPRDIYYWWIVHPLLDVEPLAPIDPYTGKLGTEPKGMLWREFFLKSETQLDSQERHFLLSTPNTIDQTILSDIESATTITSTLQPSEVGGDDIIRASSDHAPLLIHFSPSGGLCNTTTPQSDGIYLVTTLPLEKAALNGSKQLLENLLIAGPGRRALKNEDRINYSTKETQARKVLIVRDRIPYDASEDPNETILKEKGYEVDVLTSADFSALITNTGLYTTEKPYINLSYNKIVIPSDQPLALYQMLETNRTEIETFVKYSGVFQFHGATRKEDHWQTLTMPGGFKASDYLETGIGSIERYGTALLPDVISHVDYLWTGVRRCSRKAPENCPHGDRPMDQCVDAIDCIGWFNGQMIDRNVAEERCFLNGADPERTVFPQRIVVNHYGNCGENQDVIGAAARALLIPNMLTRSIEDHVWNEFYADNDRWWPHDTGWSDTPMRVGDYTVSGDGDSGKSKENASILGWRGDGQIVNLLRRYPATFDTDDLIDNDYTKSLTITINIIDKNNRPVDGALVTLLSESYYTSSYADRVIFGHSDAEGKVEFIVGDNRNYYINVDTKLGAYPKAQDFDQYYITDPNMLFQILTKAEAIADIEVEKTIKLEGKNNAGKEFDAITEITPTASSKSARKDLSVLFNFNIKHTMLAGLNPINGREFIDMIENGNLTLYLTNKEGYQAYLNNQAFEVFWTKEHINSLKDSEITLPNDNDDLVLIISNKDKLVHRHYIESDLSLVEHDVDSGGCQINNRFNPSILLGLLFLAFVRIRKARDKKLN